MGKNLETYQAIIKAWKAKDIDAVLGHMHDDIVWHFAVAAEPPIVGKAVARKFLTRFGADIGENRWRFFDYAESGERLFVEGVDEFVNAAGVTIASPYAGVLDFKDGLVIGWRDYVDVGVMAAQRAGAAITKQVAALMDRPAVS